MKRLDIAGARFAAALADLEKAATPLVEAASSADGAKAKIAALSHERETLLARVAQLEQEIQTLESLTSEVETKLDGAIAEIRVALGR
jgi:predicted phage-related endonuclease